MTTTLAFFCINLKLEGDDAGGLTPRPQHILVTGLVVGAGDLGGFIEEVWGRVQELELVLLLETLLGHGVLPQQLDVRGDVRVGVLSTDHVRNVKKL